MLTTIFFFLPFVIHSTQMIFYVASSALSQDKGDAKTDDIHIKKRAKCFYKNKVKKCSKMKQLH